MQSLGLLSLSKIIPMRLRPWPLRKPSVAVVLGGFQPGLQARIPLSCSAPRNRSASQPGSRAVSRPSAGGSTTPAPRYHRRLTQWTGRHGRPLLSQMVCGFMFPQSALSSVAACSAHAMRLRNGMAPNRLLLLNITLRTPCCQSARGLPCDLANYGKTCPPSVAQPDEIRHVTARFRTATHATKS